MRRLFLSFLLGIIAIFICHGQNPGDSAHYYFLKARKASAAGDFENSVDFLKRILSKEHPLSDYRLALIRNDLGHAYYETGRLEDAILQYRMAESLIPDAGARNIQLRISILTNKALYHNALGDFSNSLFYHNEAYRLLNKVDEWDERSYKKLSALLLNGGITYYHMGQNFKALEDLKESEKIKEEYNHPYQGSVYFNLARVYKRLNDAEKSRMYFLKSIKRWKSEYNETYYELANIYLHFGLSLSEWGQAEQGMEYLEMALANYQLNYGIVHPLTAACYNSIASHCLEEGDWKEALDYIQLAFQSISEGFKNTDYRVNPSLESSSLELTFLKILANKTQILGMASRKTEAELEKIKYLEAALATNKLSVDLLFRIRNSFHSSESRIYLNSKQKDLFSSGIQLNLDMFRLTGSEKYKEEAFMMAARGKAGELLYEMKSKEWLYLESLSDPLAISTTDLKGQMDHLSNLIYASSMDMNPDSLYIAQMQDQLYQTQDSFNKRMGELRNELPNIGQFESTRTDFTLKQIRRRLRRNETLIEYFIAGSPSNNNEQLYTFVVTKKDCQAYWSGLDSTFHQNLQTMTENLHDFVPYKETPQRFDSLKQALFSLYQDLIQDLEPALNKRNLIIVPDDELNFIPFDALITKLDSESIANYAGVSYLLHRYNISYVYSSQLIAQDPSRLWRFPKLIAWIPGYATAHDNSYQRLKGAEEEIQSIFEITKGRQVRDDLEKQELMTELEGNTILHLAMHSLARDPSTESPYFILDSINDPLLSNQIHDYEINALNISSPMVVLSSCETAGGELYKGEGVMSLSRSFLQAGAGAVVHSLWPVEDVKSREIMVGFYREIKKGYSKSTALSRVKKQYISEQPPFYTHPYYWAAIQLTGNTSPLHTPRKASLGMGFILLGLMLFYGMKRRSFRRRT